MAPYFVTGKAMKITIINGNPSNAGGGFDAFLERTAGVLRSPDWGGHLVREIKLRELNIKPCVGCFGCWFKTPGLCVHKDDSAVTSKAVVNSDFVIHASPMIMGFTSALMRRAAEKVIADLLPYFHIIKGEVRHKWRYGSRAPAMGVLLGKEDDSDEEDLDIVREVYRQLTLETQTELRFVLDSNSSVHQVANAINAD